MKKLLLLLSLILLLAPQLAFAQIATKPNILGTSITVPPSDDLPSLGLNLWLPETEEKQPLRLLIVIDGQRYFNYAVSMHHLLQDYGWAPPFAILGVDTSENRWPVLSGQRAEILEVLQSQVLPFIEKNHLISQERILFGWEAAGGFTLKAVIDKPEMFKGFIAASPSPLYGEYFPTFRSEYLQMIESMTTNGKGKHLYVAQGSYDYPQYLGINKLKSGLDFALEQSKGEKLRYRFETIEDARHPDLGFEALLRGMRDYFYYFDKPAFMNLRDFYEAGGHQFLDSYFEKQKEQFGYTEEQVAQNRLEILRELAFMPLMDGDLEAFQKYFRTLQDTDFLARNHTNHIYGFGLFLLQQGDIEGADQLFTYISERDPDNALPFNGLGLVAKARDQATKARELFEKAVKLGQKNQGFRLPQYEGNLERAE